MEAELNSKGEQKIAFGLDERVTGFGGSFQERFVRAFDL